MDSLPPEIKLKIFNQLSIRDSIKSRQVCKDWLTIIDCLRYTSLDFYVSFNDRSDANYYERDIELWILNFKKFFRTVKNDPKFNRIKVMNATGYLWQEENLGIFINHFHELEELYLNHAPNVEKFVLNLKYLKKLKFAYPQNEVKLETPSLTHLTTSKLTNFEICYPEQIKYLVTENTSKLNRFKNLEFLFINTNFSNTLSQLSAEFLLRLPQLKRVYIHHEQLNLKNRGNQISIEKKSDLQVYYYGFRINSDLFGNFDWTHLIRSDIDEFTSFMVRNYLTSIDDNPHHFCLDYTRFQDEFEQNIPNDFWKKISKFHTIIFRNLDDEEKILKFLVSTKPSCVSIENQTLSKSFLEQLSKFSFINNLRINIDEWPAFLDEFNFYFKNENIHLDFQIRCSLNSLRPMFEIFEKARLIQLTLHISIYGDEFRLGLVNYFHNWYKLMHTIFGIKYTLNGELISTSCEMESLDFCFYLDRQVPNIVELKDKLRVFFLVEEYKVQRKIEEKIKRKLYRNPTILIKF